MSIKPTALIHDYGLQGGVRDTVLKFGCMIAIATLDAIVEFETTNPSHVLQTVLKQYDTMATVEKLDRAPGYLKPILSSMFLTAGKITSDVLWQNRFKKTEDITEAWLVAYNNLFAESPIRDATIYEDVLKHLCAIADEAAKEESGILPIIAPKLILN